MSKIGYARVSTADQTHDLQYDALTRAGCGRIFTDTASGALDERPQLTAALDYLREGDTLVVWRLDRLGRSLRHLIDTMTGLEERGIRFASLTEGFDTSTPGGELVFHIFGALAQFERRLIKERVNAGLEAARARGRVGGRPTALTETQIRMARQMYDERGDDGKRRYTVQEIAATFNVGRATIYRHLNQDKGSVS